MNEENEMKIVVCTGVVSTENVKEELSLKIYERNAIVKILEECLEEMTNSLRIKNIKKKKNHINLNFVPTDAKYLDLIKSRLLYTSEERALRDMETKAIFQKLESDSTYAFSIIEEILDELKSDGKFTILTNIPNNINEEKINESYVILKSKKNIQALKNLKEVISLEKNINEFERNESVEKLAATLKEMEIECSKGEASIAYVSAWEKARNEQNVARCKIVEDKLNQTLTKLEIDEKNENRITKEMEAFLCENIEKNEEEIINWNNRYDQEWSEYRRKIERLDKQINLEKKELERLLEEQRVKQKFIDEYLAEKESDRKKYEHEEHVRKSTIKIQSWWRGVMVRKKLGPYRPDEKKKKRSNKSKK